MSLPALTAASGVYYETASFTFPTSEGTFAVIARFDDDTVRQNLMHTAFPPDAGMDWRGDVAGDTVSITRQGTTYASASANVGNFSTYALGAWMSLIGVWDATSTRLYMGRYKGAVPVQPSAYASQTTIVAPNTTAAALRVMNSTANTARHFRGPMAVLAIDDIAWASDRLNAFNQGRFIPGCVLFHYIGGNGSVVDASGNGWTATFTGSPTVVTGPASPRRSRHTSSRSARRAEVRGGYAA